MWGICTICEVSAQPSHPSQVRDVAMVQDGPRAVARRLLVGAAASCVAVMLASCGRGHPRAVDPTTTTAPVATTSTLPAEQAAVTQAWRHYWDIYVAVGSEMHLPDPRLVEVATGEELRTLGGAFLADMSQGHVLKGTTDLDPKVVSVVAGTATLRDCYFSRILVYSTATGQPIGSGDTNRSLVTATLVLDGGTWKVSAIRHEGDGCVAP